MKCPYCTKEMKKGLIHSDQELSWINGEKRKFFTPSFLYEDSVVLSDFSFLKGSAVVAYRCVDCEKIIIDYSDETSDLNYR